LCGFGWTPGLIAFRRVAKCRLFGRLTDRLRRINGDGFACID
jgi:hypothetical protein